MARDEGETGQVHLQPSVDLPVGFEGRSGRGGCRWEWDGEVETTTSVGARLL